MYAVWLLFQKEDELYLRKIINKLSKDYCSSTFIPHITVYGLVKAPLDILKKDILENIKNIKPFKIKKKEISYSNNFWKTVFIDFDSESNMLHINQSLTKLLAKYASYEFKPHASLIYKKLSSEKKKKISQTLEIKNEFQISHIGIQKFYNRIEDWKLIQKYELKDRG